MKTVKNFTTTLPSPVLNWLDVISKETNLQKNDIIENALKLWKKKYTQSKIAESYKNAINDPEWINFGNSEMNDWGEIKETSVLKNKKYV